MSEDDETTLDEEEEHHDDEHRHRTGIRRRLGRLLNQRELAEDTREVIGGVLDISDRAKTEAVRLVAREVRHYLDELRIMDDMKELVTSHSLEVKLSLHLKPLPGTEAADTPAAKERPAPRAEPEPEPVDEESQVDEDEDEVPRDPTEEAPA